MATQITLPNLGENIESGDVLSLLVSEGDTITVDQDIVEIETDKATMPVPSPTAGTVTKILVAEGDTVAVGAAILEVDAASADSAGDIPSNASIPEPARPDGQASEPAPQTEEPAPQAPPAAAPTPSTPAPAPAAPPAPAPVAVQTPPPAPAAQPTAVAEAPAAPTPAVDVPGDGYSAAAAGPAVRRLARELGVDLRRVRSNSSDGRLTEDDVRAHVRAGNQQAAAANTQGTTPPGLPDSDSQGAVRREKMSRMRQTIARNMMQSYSTIPQLTNFDDVDTTELEHLRKESKDDYAAKGIKLTAMPFIVKALASALRDHPIVNASIDEAANEIVYKEYVNIGIAVDTEKGLVVPVLRDADRKNIPTIAREIAELAESVRDGTFSIDDLRGGTFTISNLGAIGGTYSTPIINPPEVAILLVGRSRMLPHWIKDKGAPDSGTFQPRLMMPLSLTYDHRIVDGAAAARFLNDVKGYLANPGRLLLAP